MLAIENALVCKLVPVSTPAPAGAVASTLPASWGAPEAPYLCSPPSENDFLGAASLQVPSQADRTSSASPRMDIMIHGRILLGETLVGKTMGKNSGKAAGHLSPHARQTLRQVKSRGEDVAWSILCAM